MIGVPLLLLLIVLAEEPVKPKFPLGKETTYVTGPLDKDGYVNYEAALNERLGKGVTPETNANVLIWKAIGPRPEGVRMLREYFNALGIDEPEERGEYFIALHAYLKDRLKIDKPQADAIAEQWSRASLRPWAAKDYPHVAGWLTANEKPLAIVIEATKRPLYFNPMIASRTEGERGPLIGALLPSVQKCRELAAALTARSMLRISEGNFDDAWADLLACHRLGRLVSRGASLIELLVAIAIDQIVNLRVLVYIERAPLTGRQMIDRLNDQRNLPRLATVAEKVDLGERFLVLDAFRFVRRGGLDFLNALEDKQPSKKPDLGTALIVAAADWEPALRNSNRWFDRQVTILRIHDRSAREQEMAKYLGDLKAMKESASKANSTPPTGESIGNVVIALMMPAIQKLQVSQDRHEQTRQNVYLAFALAAYRSDNHRYPAKLDDLAPKYLAVIPGDLFSGKSLIYRPTENGYLFYSVGVNGKDDGGRFYDDDPPGDDLGVRMPLPPLKKQNRPAN